MQGSNAGWQRDMQEQLERYYLARHDQGPQPNYMTWPLTPNNIITSGQHAGQRRCRLCHGLCTGVQCLACHFFYCHGCLQDCRDGQVCLRADCVSTFQVKLAEGKTAWEAYIQSRSEEERGLTHTVQAIQAQSTVRANTLGGASSAESSHSGPVRSHGCN